MLDGSPTHVMMVARMGLERAPTQGGMESDAGPQEIPNSLGDVGGHGGGRGKDGERIYALLGFVLITFSLMQSVFKSICRSAKGGLRSRIN